MKEIKKLVPILFLSVLFACDGENVDEILEQELNREPEIVFKDEGKLNYLIDQVPLYDSQGFGALIDDVIYVVSSDSIFCSPGGGVQGSLVSEDAFVLYIARNLDDSYSLLSGFFEREIEGEKSTILINPACKAQVPQINITEANGEFISGSFEGEGYVLRPNQGGFNCDSLANSGKFTASFSVPIKKCE